MPPTLQLHLAERTWPYAAASVAIVRATRHSLAAQLSAANLAVVEPGLCTWAYVAALAVKFGVWLPLHLACIESRKRAYAVVCQSREFSYTAAKRCEQILLKPNVLPQAELPESAEARGEREEKEAREVLAELAELHQYVSTALPDERRAIQAKWAAAREAAAAATAEERTERDAAALETALEETKQLQGDEAAKQKEREEHVAEVRSEIERVTAAVDEGAQGLR